jgi:hypothetical protein
MALLGLIIHGSLPIPSVPNNYVSRKAKMSYNLEQREYHLLDLQFSKSHVIINAFAEISMLSLSA